MYNELYQATAHVVFSCKLSRAHKAVFIDASYVFLLFVRKLYAAVVLFFSVWQCVYRHDVFNFGHKKTGLSTCAGVPLMFPAFCFLAFILTNHYRRKLGNRFLRLPPRWGYSLGIFRLFAFRLFLGRAIFYRF